MAIKPGMGRKSSNKNPPFLSHEFVIQNHADIVSCFAMIFVVGLMLQATNSVASIFIALHHNVTGADPSHENPQGEPYFYTTGWKDGCAVFFYMLICIIMHAILQEYALDKISKKLHLSKFKLSRFNESGQLVVFYAMSFLWGFDVIVREQYLGNVAKLWEGFPDHPMVFLHKLFFIIQMAYYWHILPELYFQKVKKDEQKAKVQHAVVGFFLIATAYFLGFHRIALVLLMLHYFCEFIAHSFQLVNIFDKDEKFVKLRIIHNVVFILTRFATMVLTFLTLFYGINDVSQTKRSFMLATIFGLQGYLIFDFISNVLRSKRERSVEHSERQAKAAATKIEKTKKERKKESDLPEADQNAVQSTPSSTVSGRGAKKTKVK
ncbi:translocating chain-associated membrane protein 1 [Malaya genurostris]|uniref:translocating chain-associated membrane protein 1 n=1 Tax=Malaya genurostris TaxID=325434 RepID=UPI0026F3A341|nr:translocating chain-associated membrane protein 1 [Malaya genurostris]XP_058461695.1 translocating chain-associated membrane protein 1 [Malaya genurostris]